MRLGNNEKMQTWNLRDSFFYGVKFETYGSTPASS